MSDFPRNTVLMRQDDLGTSMFVLTGGKAAVSVRTPSGDKRVATLCAGDIVGEMSLMTGARRSATVTTLKPVTAVEIGKVALAAMIVRLPDLVQRFAGVMEQRQAELARIRDGHGWYGGGLSRAELAARMTAFYAG